MTKSKRWTAAEKSQIVLEGLRGESSIAELCRRHGFDQSQFYCWREAFLAGARQPWRGIERMVLKLACREALRVSDIRLSNPQFSSA